MERIAELEKEKAAAENMKDRDARTLRLLEMQGENAGSGLVSDLPDPVMYPIVLQEGDECEEEEEQSSSPDYIRTGIPDFRLVMRVDIQGKFGKEKSVTAFQNSFGMLPQRALLEVTQMLFKSSRNRKQKQNSSSREEDQELPADIFLKQPFLMQEYTRLKTYQPEEINMDGFRKAGCDLHLYNKMMGVVRSCEDPVGKICFLNDFYERITRQHISSVLNKELRSSHALHQVIHTLFLSLP